MNENKTKLDLLRSEIEQSSEKETAAIIEAAKKSADEALSNLTKELESEHEKNLRTITENFRAEEKKRVSEMCFSEGKRVLLHRSALADEFFAKVEQKLKTMLDTPKYTAFLAASVRKADENFPLNSKATVLCRECDIAAVDTVLKGINCSLEAAKDIKLGGIMVSYPENGMLIDLTLDAALEAEREKFSALKEMQI